MALNKKKKKNIRFYFSLDECVFNTIAFSLWHNFIQSNLSATATLRTEEIAVGGRHVEAVFFPPGVPTLWFLQNDLLIKAYKYIKRSKYIRNQTQTKTNDAQYRSSFVTFYLKKDGVLYTPFISH